jgi:hypothetical protein
MDCCLQTFCENGNLEDRDGEGTVTLGRILGK